MDFLTPDMITGLAAAMGTASVLVARNCWRWISAFASGTPIKIDDKIYAAVREAILDDAEGVE